MTVVLRSGEQPALSRAQIHRVMHAHQAHARYMAQRANLHDSDDDDGPEDDDAWLYEDLNILAKLYARLRDREQLIELIFEVCFDLQSQFSFTDLLDSFVSPLRATRLTCLRTSSLYSTLHWRRFIRPPASQTHWVTCRISLTTSSRPLK